MTMQYGFIGLGNLGFHLCKSLIDKGFAVTVSDINPAAAETLISAGAKWAGTPQALAAGADAVLTCLPSPQGSEKVLLQLLETMRPGAVWIEMSTLGRDD